MFIVITMILSVTMLSVSCFQDPVADSISKDGSADPKASLDGGESEGESNRFDLMNKVLNFIEDRFYDEMDYDVTDLYAALGIVASLGEFNYLYPIEDLYASSSSDGKGFGLLLRTNVYNERLVDFILPGSPFLSPSNGYTVQRGDEIYAINGKRISGLDNSSYSAILSAIGDDPAVFTMKREGVTFEVEYAKVKITFPYCLYINDLAGVSTDFGYIYLRTFDNGTNVLNEFNQAVKSFNADGNKALILDLRGNGGGSADVFRAIASSLIGDVAPGDPLLQISYVKKYQPYTYTSIRVEERIDTPIYVLCDGGTASASEALIGTMKAHGTLTALIGQKTVGKGVAQNGPSEGVLEDKGVDDDGKSISVGDYVIQVVIGKYYIYDASYEGGKYCMHGIPFVPDFEVSGTNVISEDYSEDIYIAEAIRHYNAQLSS